MQTLRDRIVSLLTSEGIDETKIILAEQSDFNRFSLALSRCIKSGLSINVEVEYDNENTFYKKSEFELECYNWLVEVEYEISGDWEIEPATHDYKGSTSLNVKEKGVTWIKVVDDESESIVLFTRAHENQIVEQLLNILNVS